MDAPQETEEGEKTMIEIVKLMYEHPFITIALMLACSAMLSALGEKSRACEDCLNKYARFKV